MPQVRAEAGCVEYGPAVDAETPLARQTKLGEDVVMIVEKWQSLLHLEAHLVAPHMTPYRERVKDLVKSVQLHVLEPAG
jgi:quinol monooxygenase YgiN